MQIIQQAAKLLTTRFSPERLILFSHKINPDGQTASFKLCMVAGVSDKRAALREIFSAQSADALPFDIVIYTPREWADALSREGSFANRVERTGRDLLG